MIQEEENRILYMAAEAIEKARKTLSKEKRDAISAKVRAKKIKGPTVEEYVASLEHEFDLERQIVPVVFNEQVEIIHRMPVGFGETTVAIPTVFNEVFFKSDEILQKQQFYWTELLIDACWQQKFSTAQKQKKTTGLPPVVFYYTFVLPWQQIPHSN